MKELENIISEKLSTIGEIIEFWEIKGYKGQYNFIIKTNENIMDLLEAKSVISKHLGDIKSHTHCLEGYNRIWTQISI
ncbi:MAG: hypothetical protein SLAVMIC_00752 [uncultured marine phage]|uniref:Uncharacterized protein n=1 Tax=uncultured marine phage TaxID=707152 RepID=A0A8D9CCQ5_9VIRU|nr:MAG: hypothetical protein SLAVMIC_00752 [uncultured marine phage]